MPKAPIELTLYDADDEPIITHKRLIIPWGILKNAVRLAKRIGKNASGVSEEDLDELSGMVIQIFGEEKVTREDLDRYADVADMIATIQSIVARGASLIPNAPPAGK